MTHRTHATGRAALALAPLLLACAAAPHAPEPLPEATRARPAVLGAGDQVGLSLASYGPPARQDGYRNRSLELSIWNSKDFRTRFARSYLADTEVEPTLTVDETETMQEVLELMGADRLVEAVELLKATSTPASSAVFDFTLGNLHFQDENLNQAIEAYRGAVDKFPAFRRAWKNLGLIHVRHGDFDLALGPLTRVIELGGSDALTYGLLGFSYSSVGNEISAESAYRMATLLDPGTMDWKMGLARSFFKQERFADAAAFLGNLIDDEPDRAELWLLQANAYIGLGQPLRAAENFELVDQLGASTADSLNMLADIYVNEELYEVASVAYARALELADRAGMDRALQAARVLAARSHLDGSIDLLDRLTAMGGLGVERRKDVLRLRARIAVAQGAGEDEAEILREIVTLDPLDGEALILLGQYHQRGGDTEQAIFYYERAAGLEAFEADAKVRHAQALVGAGRYAEALPLLERSLQVEPRTHVQEYLDQVKRMVPNG